MKILIVKLGAIGDIVHTLPVLAAIRHEMPKSEISWAVEKRSAEILRGNEVIDNLIEVDTRSIRGKAATEILPEIASQLKELRKFKFDIALDLQGLLKSGMIAKLSGARRRWGFSKTALREPASRIFLTKTVDIPPQTHVIRKNLMLAAEALKIPVPDENFEFPIFASEEHRAEADEIIEKTGSEFAILNPAGGWVTKLWHAEKFGQLADRIYEKYGMISAIATGPNEETLAETVRKNSRSGKLVLAQPSLKGFYELAKRSKIYVGGDTGPTHIAVAAGARVVGLFGPTEWWRNGSPNYADICVERTDIACRIDCHRRQCTNWICMDSDVETVFSAVIRRIAI
ncbi:MAG TPA: lipopolysaccharide heptosyltransferase I [Pyrinomonadaceae bacterium]|nr:lipopolysaccharide heptosyltransferase I [Pyrinomonadaceae bacterium]